MIKGWETKKLGDVCIIERGGSPRPIDAFLTDSEDGVNWIKIGDATIGSKYITSTKEKIRPEGVKKSRMVYKGDFILSNSMSFGKPYILGVDGCIHDGWLVIRDYNNLFDKSFLYYYLGSPNIYREFKRLAVGGVVNNLNSELVRGVNVLIPSRLEQEKIVAELDCLSGIIEKKKRQLKELDNLAQSIFHEMFGNPLRNERGWGMKRIADVCVVNPPKKVTAQGLGNKDVVSFLPMEDLPIKACYHQPDKTRLYEEVQSSYTCFANDDVLMAKVTPCFENGKLGIATNLHNGVGYGSSEFIVIRANNVDVIKEYIYFVTMDSLFIEKACAQLTGTSGLRRVPRQYVENCNITLPPLVLQHQFASKIEAIEKQKELIKQSIQEAEILFNSRMDYYFN